MPKIDRSLSRCAVMKAALLILPIAIAGCGGGSGDSQSGATNTGGAAGGGAGQSTPVSTTPGTTTPGIPTTPDTPAVPDAPTTPSTPTTPGTPTTPTTPGSPTTPGTPTTPGAPGTPGSPTTPAICPTPVVSAPFTPYGTAMPPADPKQPGVTHKFFKITVRDALTNLPVAGVQLKTVSRLVYTTDDNGVAAFYEPGAMDRDVWFTPVREGYTIGADGLGLRGAKLRATEGGAATISLTPSGTAPAIVMGNLQSRLLAANVPGKAQCMTVRVFDKRTGRGLPLVALGLPSGEQTTDSQGILAYCNPDKMGALSVPVSSHGYLAKTVALQATPGGVAQIELESNYVGQRLYRITGQGTYRDSLLLGLTIPIQNGALNGQVVGQDSVISAVYKNKVFWTWGDTDNLSYGLGNFSSPGATSLLPGAGGLDPDRGVDLTYLGNPSGFVNGSAPNIAPTGNPTWIGAMVAVPDSAGNEKLFASFSKPDGNMAPLKNGLIKFDDTAQVFKPVIEDYPLDGDNYPSGGQAFKFDTPTRQYAYFKGGKLRIPATAEAMVDRASYEVFTPFLDANNTQLDRVGNTLQYKWRKGGSGLSKIDAAITGAGLDAGQALDGHMRSFADGGGIGMASTSLSWNEYRGRFVMIGQHKYGTPSVFGEIWYAEADTPMGPWVDARKVVSHNNYTFYNPYTHPYLSPDKGKTVYFEATYTSSFSTAPVITPLYNYNQMMYRVDVDDAQLKLPVPIYDQGGASADQFGAKQSVAPGAAPLAAPFLALDRAAAGTTPIGWSAPACDASRRLVSGAGVLDPLFFAAPSAPAAPMKSMVALYEYNHADGRRVYTVDATQAPAGFVRAAAPLAWVWSNPVKVKLPVGDYRGNLVVNAGADQCVAKGASATTAVTLNATAVRKAAGGEPSYRWHVPASQVTPAQCESVLGARAVLQLAVGTHKIVVEATDAAGNISADTVVVRVK